MTRGNRTPTKLIDQLTIYIFNQNNRGVPVSELSRRTGKDVSTIRHHLRRYEALHRFDKVFKESIAGFNEAKFEEKFVNVKKRNSNYKWS